MKGNKECSCSIVPESDCYLHSSLMWKRCCLSKTKQRTLATAFPKTPESLTCPHFSKCRTINPSLVGIIHSPDPSIQVHAGRHGNRKTPCMRHVATIASSAPISKQSNSHELWRWSKSCEAAFKYLRNPRTGMSGSGPSNKQSSPINRRRDLARNVVALVVGSTPIMI